MSFLSKARWLALSMAIVPAAADADSLKIGIIEPLTGSVAASGNFITNGAKLAAEEVNANGGILNHPVELVIEDNKSNPSGSASAAEKLLSSDQVNAIMGAWGSTFTLAVMPKLVTYNTPLVVETASSEKITTSGNPWVFRIAPTSQMEAQAFASYVKKFGIRKADFLVSNDDWGRGAAAAFAKVLKAQGAQVGGVQVMDPGAQDLSAQLGNVKSSDADTLFVTTGYEQLSLVLKQARSQGLARRVITTGGSQFPDLLAKQLGTEADDTYHILFFAPWFATEAANPEVAKRYVDDWKAHGWDEAGLSDGFRGYDAITAIAAAAELAKSAKPEAIRDALWKVNVHAVNGDVKFVPVGPASGRSGQSAPQIYVVGINDGRLKLVK